MSEDRINHLLAVQRQFCWQAIQVKFDKVLSTLDHDERVKLMMIVKNATDPTHCVNYSIIK